MILYTIGHGNRSTSELISLLKENGVTQVVDARTSPYSRHHPQFTQENLEFFLAYPNEIEACFRKKFDPYSLSRYK